MYCSKTSFVCKYICYYSTETLLSFHSMFSKFYRFPSTALLRSLLHYERRTTNDLQQRIKLQENLTTILCQAEFTFYTTEKMKFSIKDFFSKDDLRIWSHLLKKSLMENFIFCAVMNFQFGFDLNLLYLI